MGLVFLFNQAGEVLLEGTAKPAPIEIADSEGPEEAARLFAIAIGLRPGRTLARTQDVVALLVEGTPEDSHLAFWPVAEAVNHSPALADALKQATQRTDDLLHLSEELPESFVVTPAWVSLSGSIIYADPARQPNDVDVIVRDTELSAGIQLKLSRIIQSIYRLPPHFVLEPTGPSWSHLPVYDLVAVRRNPLRVEEISEPEFAGEFYKADPSTRPGHYLGQYSAAGEFYAGEEDQIWEKWARRAVERGTPILVQEKFDGFRFHVHHWAGGFKVFSDQGIDRAHVFPRLASLLPEDIVFDAEFVQFVDDDPVERWKMGWMGSAKDPPDPYPKITIYVHDLLYAQGKSWTDAPYTERLKEIERLFKNQAWRGYYRILPVKSRPVTSEVELKEAIAWASAQPGSEGAMLKFADFRYMPKTLAEVAKFKSSVEIDCQVIGWRKVPRAKPKGEPWSRAEAFEKLPESLAESQTYILRVAIKDGDRLIPLESDSKLTPQDLLHDWDPERQIWVGTDDPALWSMCPGFPERQVGEYKYANTYAYAFEEPPQCGLVVTVAPMRFRPFLKEDGSQGYAWMFPRVKNLKGHNKPVAQLSSVLAAFKLTKAEAFPRLAIVGDGPGETDEETGQPFSGPSGQFLRELLAEEGIDPQQVYFTNVYKTRSAKLTQASLEIARADLERELQAVPGLSAILGLSEIAGAALTGLRQPIAELRGKTFTFAGLPVVLSRHPAFLLRTGGKSAPGLADLRADLRRALTLAHLLKSNALAHNPDHYPEEDKIWRFVIQVHFRGQSAHADLRCQISPEVLEGWTIAVQRPQQLSQPIVSLSAARAALADEQAWKLNWESGVIHEREVMTTIAGQPRRIIRPGGLWATPKKAEIVASWLEVEGQSPRHDPGEPPPVGATRNYPAIFLIADQGRVEFGARKPWFFEYFLKGKHFEGRYILRAVERQEKADEPPPLPPGQPTEDRGTPFFWVFSRASWPPYVLSTEAVKADWLPPQGVSCLPSFMRSKVPEKLQFWRLTGAAALEARHTLAESFEEWARDW